MLTIFNKTRPGRSPQKGDTIQTVLEDGSVIEELVTESSDTDMAIFQARRYKKFEEVRWVRDRHQDRMDKDGSDPDWDDWLDYFDTLRDMPDQPGFDPASPQWPTRPDESS